MQMMLRGLIFAVVTLPLPAHEVFGQRSPLVRPGLCATPIADVDRPEIIEWFDLYSIDPSERLNPALIERVQKPATTGSGRTNLDYYEITFDRPAGQTVEGFFRAFRN